ncbi:hypothetical protein JTB14_006878 [Gonioctena quinquepunctata]|nr:hypothetical protein JTB14_006878 [Gonioctena quinquepunctata]
MAFIKKGRLPKDVPKKKFTCYVCWQIFGFKHELLEHNKTHVRQEKQKEDAPASQTDDPAPQKEKKKRRRKSKEAIIVSPNAPAYRCESCKVDFLLITEVKKHQTNNCRFNCSECNRIYNTVHGFTIHILQHKINATKPKSSQQFNCTECPESFTDMIQLRSHNLISHKIIPKEENIENKDRSDDLSCELCFDVFQSKTDLEEHMEFHKQLGSKSVEQEKRNNTITNERVDRDADVVTKFEVESLNTTLMLPKEEGVHDGTIAEEDDTASNSSGVSSFDAQNDSETYFVVSPNETIPNIHYRCKKCQRMYTNLDAFEDHLIKNCELIEICKECDARLDDNMHFYKHMKTHIDTYTCKYCFMTTSDSLTKDTHMLEHLKDLENLCKICFKGFSTPTEFDAHLKEHLSI